MLPESSISEKIIKLRYCNQLERKEFASSINCHFDTVAHWEDDGIMPKPFNIKKICDEFNFTLDYFHDYYSVFFSNYQEKILKWKLNKKISYIQFAEILAMNEVSIKKIASGKIPLSFSTYIKLKELNIL